MANPLTVPVAGRPYAILDSREPLPENGDAHIDHDEQVIWIGPHVRPEQRPAAYARAVAQACRERGQLQFARLTLP